MSQVCVEDSAPFHKSGRKYKLAILTIFADYGNN